MAYFNNSTTSSGIWHLVVSDDEQQKWTQFRVYPPANEKYAPPVKQTQNEYYLVEWTREISLSKTSNVWILKAANHCKPTPNVVDHLSTLGRRIIMGTTEWSDSMKFVGEFHFNEGYWEWTEDVLSRCKRNLREARIYDVVFASLFTYDCSLEIVKAFCEAWCPSTNSLLTSIGEMSISLWDLFNCTGLPLTGLLYDEVVPDEHELLDKIGNLRIPSSCKYLFHAYHILCGGTPRATISIEKWIDFWSSKTLKYMSPPARNEKKMNARPKSTHNPSGILGDYKEWTPAEITSFKRLGIEGKHQEETYLAAFISCWLCAFVLPNDAVDLIMLVPML